MSTKNKKMRGPFGVVDIGATKLACLILQSGVDGKLQLLGQAVHAADGVRNGEISDLNSFGTALGKAVESAEQNAGAEIKTIHIVSAFGEQTLQHDTHEIQLLDQAISKRDIARLRQKYQASQSDEFRFVLQSIEYDFILDDHISVENPLGMFARQIGVNYAELSIQRTSWMSMLSAAHINHLEIGQMHHSAAMSALACLTDDMRNAGTLMIDFGGGSTSIAIYDKGYLQLAGTVKMGGNHITRDIAKIFGITLQEAERAKALDGSALPSLAEIPLPSAAGFPLKGDNFVSSNLAQAMQTAPHTSLSAEQFQLLPSIIISRLDEIMELVELKISAAKMGPISQYHIAVTGGGSQLTGLSEYLSEKYTKSIFLRGPEGLNGLDGQISGGSFAAAMGMTGFVTLPEDNREDVTHTPPHGPSTSKFRWLGKFGKWLETHL